MSDLTSAAHDSNDAVESHDTDANGALGTSDADMNATLDADMAEALDADNDPDDDVVVQHPQFDEGLGT